MKVNKITQFSLILAIFLIPILTSNAYGQKGLDGEETPKNTATKTDKKAPVGKGLDDGAEPTNGSKPKTGKGLDDDGKIPIKADRIEPKPKAEPLIRIGPAAAEKVPVKPHKESKIEKSEPSKQQEETDVGAQYPEMVTLPAGTFIMGSKDGQENENPIHEVSLSSFEISKYEVTNHQFRIFVKATGYKTTAEEEKAEQSWKSYAIFGRARYPVVYVTYQDALAYCNWLSATTKQIYRLPSEAEWEYAARGGTQDQPYPWGKDIEVTKANYAYDESRKAYGEPILDYLKPVGSYTGNGFGVYDVIGNVAEWCLDGFKADFYKESPKQNPVCPSQGSARVVRGGGWMNSISFCSVSFRKNHPGGYKSSSLGFRVVHETKSTQSAPIAEAMPASNSQISGSTASTKDTKINNR